MARGFPSFYSAAWRTVVALLTVEIAVASMLAYFTDVLPAPPPVVANQFANPFLPIHVLSGVVSLLLGPIQFVATIRARWPRAHRWSGRLYVLACAISAPTGLVLAFGTTSGPVAAGGFAIPALLLPIFTWFGWRAAVERRFDEHRQWMLRSYGMTSNAITLRLLLPASMLMGIDFSTAYPVIAWLSWMTNLLLFEYVIRRSRRSSAAFPSLAAA